jgi:hypothetical protein
MYFDFVSLINKYSTSFRVILSSATAYDNKGDEVHTEEEKELTGAIISISDSKIYQSAGTLTSADKYLFTFEPLPIINTKVIYKNKAYKVESQVENAELTGVYQYTLKYISAFGKED